MYNHPIVLIENTNTNTYSQRTESKPWSERISQFEVVETIVQEMMAELNKNNTISVKRNL